LIIEVAILPKWMKYDQLIHIPIPICINGSIVVQEVPISGTKKAAEAAF